METLLSSSNIEGLRRKLGFDDCFVVDLMGRSAGITLLWKSIAILSQNANRR